MVVAAAQLMRTMPLAPAALRFWRSLLVAFGLMTVGYAWLAVDMLAALGR